MIDSGISLQSFACSCESWTTSLDQSSLSDKAPQQHRMAVLLKRGRDNIAYYRFMHITNVKTLSYMQVCPWMTFTATAPTPPPGTTSLLRREQPAELLLLAASWARRRRRVGCTCLAARQGAPHPLVCAPGVYTCAVYLSSANTQLPAAAEPWKRRPTRAGCASEQE